jgi:hypothetical protein
MEGTCHGLIWDAILEFSWRNWGNPRRTLVSIAAILLTYFAYFEKKNESRLMRSPCCLSVNPPFINLWMPELIIMYIMAREPNSAIYFINPSHQSVCLHTCIPPFIARQRLSRHVSAATNTRNNRRIVGRVCLWVCLYTIPLSLLGDNSVKTFLRQRRIAEGVVFCAVRVVSKESRLLVLPRTSCF